VIAAGVFARRAPSSIPVVAIEAPPVPDERRLYQAILR
jgi:hypothetical protein